MIWNIDSPSWWKRTIPYENGNPVKRCFKHHIKGWFLVVNPFCDLKFYYADPSAKIWSKLPPPFDEEVSTQTHTDLSTAESQTTQTFTALQSAESQTIGHFSPDLPADSNVWSTLGSSVAGLPSDRQHAVYDRLIRFLDLGFLRI